MATEVDILPRSIAELRATLLRLFLTKATARVFLRLITFVSALPRLILTQLFNVTTVVDQVFKCCSQNQRRTIIGVQQLSTRIKMKKIIQTQSLITAIKDCLCSKIATSVRVKAFS